MGDTIRVYKDQIARSIILNSTSFGSKFLNELLAINGSSEDNITIINLSKERPDIPFNVAVNILYSLFVDNNDLQLANSRDETINALNAIFTDTGSGTTSNVPIITSPLVATSNTNTHFLYTMSASYGVSYYWDNLPTGIRTINGDSRIISGSVNTPGTYNIGMTSLNYYGEDHETLVLTVNSSYINTISTLFNNHQYCNTNIPVGFPINRAGSTGVAWSISAWVKPSSSNNQSQTICSTGTGSAPDATVTLTYTGSDNALIFKYGTSSDYVQLISPDSSLTENVWSHVLLTYTGDETMSGSRYSRFTMFINGSEVTPTTSGPGYGASMVSSEFNIAKSSGQNRHLRDGFLVDELCIFDSDESTNVDIIYNSGSTQDMSALSSPPVHWYRMGDGDTYPTISDNIGSTDLTMHSMTITSFLNDAPPI